MIDVGKLLRIANIIKKLSLARCPQALEPQAI